MTMSSGEEAQAAISKFDSYVSFFHLQCKKSVSLICELNFLYIYLMELWFNQLIVLLFVNFHDLKTCKYSNYRKVHSRILKLVEHNNCFKFHINFKSLAAEYTYIYII